MSAFDGAIGPECTITLTCEGKARFDELKAALPIGENHKLPASFGKTLVERIESALEGFIRSRRITKHPIKVEEEYEPTLYHDSDSVSIGLSLSVLYDGEDYENLSDFFYSDAFENFFERELKDIVAALVSPKARWFSQGNCAVEIGGIGEG